jgi:hypothetical protein
MEALGLRLSATLILWAVATLILFQATLHFTSLISSAWFYVACAACGLPGLLIAKLNRVASLMLVPILAVAAFVVVCVVRLRYFGL